MTQAQIRNELYNIGNDGLGIEIDVGIDECRALTIAMLIMIDEINNGSCYDKMDSYHQRIVRNINNLLRIQENALDSLEKKNDTIGDKLMQIVRSIAENKTTA